MTRRIGWLAAALVLTLSAPALAQKPGTVEFGGFGRFTKFDKATHFDDRGGLGARVGIGEEHAARETGHVQLGASAFAAGQRGRGLDVVHEGLGGPGLHRDEFLRVRDPG